MSRTFLSVGAALLLFCLVPAQARENAYDVVGKVLAPYTQILAGSTQTKNRAVRLQIHLEATSGGDPRLVGAPVEFAVEMPDRLRITAPLGGERITVCRDGQKIWAFPGARLKALLADPAVAKTLPEADRKFKLAPFELPIPEQQLAFLPVLFQVKEAPDDKIDGQPCRVLDLQLQKDLAKALEFKNAKARIFVTDENRLLRVAARSEQGAATFRIDSVKFLPALPAATWQPSAEESADVMDLSPADYDQLVRGLMGRGKDGSQ